MRNYLPKRTSCALLHTLSKLYDVLVGFVYPPSFEAVYCYICGRRRVAVARYRMICLVHVTENDFFSSRKAVHNRILSMQNLTKV